MLPVEAKKTPKQQPTSNHYRCVYSLEISFRGLASLMNKKGSFNMYLHIYFLSASALAEIITMGLTHLWTWEALSGYGGKSTRDEVRAFVPWQLRDTGSQIGLGIKGRHYSSSSVVWSRQTDIISDVNTLSSMVSSEVVVRAKHTDAFSEGLCFVTPF